MKKAIMMLAMAAAVIGAQGCGPWQISECNEMSDGGSLGKHLDEWQREDEAIRGDFKPQIKRWWETEKKKWPKFRRTCINSADTYYESIETEKRNAK